MKEKKHRVEDALQATRAAARGGHRPRRRHRAPGGDSARSTSTPSRIDDEKTGARIVLRALEEPLRQIAENAGFEGSVVVNEVRRSANRASASTRPPASTSTSSAAGVIDPAMVTRSALQNAASIAKNILTTEAIVAEIADKTNGGGGMPDMGGMGGMM